MNTESIIDKLVSSDEPSIRYKTLVNVLDVDPESKKIKKLQSEIKNSKRVGSLLSHTDDNGRIISNKNVYDKWQGAHWIVASLADIGYPSNDKSLIPVKDQILSFWLKDYYYKEFTVHSKKECYKTEGVPLLNGKHRRCASQHGNALYMFLKLGFNDKRLKDLSEMLQRWQWPDGGWNCDRDPDAVNSSFMESLLPFRALALYSKINNDKKARAAAKKASEIFLKRKLFKRQSDGNVIHKEFTRLHYPLYWHYDVLGGLKVMAEAGFIKDKRCDEAFDLLERKLLTGGGWRAGSKYYKVSGKIAPGNEYVDWGGTRNKLMNEWITVDALYVLRSAGRLP